MTFSTENASELGDREPLRSLDDSADRAPGREAPAVWDPLRVLIAEDECLVALALRAKLQASGHRVVGIARDGSEAVSLCACESPDVVLMDVRMPGLDGLEATRRLMAERATCVIILTGNTLLGSEARESGAMEYVIKPIVGCQVPAIVSAAWERFQRYLAVREQSSDPDEALCAWLVVRTALTHLCTTRQIAEKDAFATLVETAAAERLSLRDAAQHMLSEADPQGL